ncbi:MAG: hypothetical protein IT381_09460 [Deltaproteobacteria bacterium]|nr:hypothetical protein [Deltaproteobacteria bacterium]
MRSSLLLLLLLASCRHYAAAPPDGFAAFELKSGDDFRAVSPDGVVFRVRDEPNKPEADLPFWKEALKKRMIEAGYTFFAESDIKAQSGEPGYLLELSAPLGPRDYSYLVAIFAKGSHIVIGEAAGEVVRVKERHDAIVTALQKTTLR